MKPQLLSLFLAASVPMMAHAQNASPTEQISSAGVAVETRETRLRRQETTEGIVIGLTVLGVLGSIGISAWRRHRHDHHDLR